MAAAGTRRQPCTAAAGTGVNTSGGICEGTRDFLTRSGGSVGVPGGPPSHS